MTKSMWWHRVLKPYKDVEECKFEQHDLKIHLSLGNGVHTIPCQVKTRELYSVTQKFSNYATLECFDRMVKDTRVPARYLCTKCLAIFQAEDWSCPSARIQLLLLAGTEL